jgi:predicted NAD/FAD-dependent oxidoreductase
VDVYTDEAKVGGRLATMRIDNREYEIGGSIIHPDNYYMVEWLKEFGLLLC